MGGLLALEYALHQQEHLKGLVFWNMVSSARLYGRHAEDVLMPSMHQQMFAGIRKLEASGATDDPRYEELLMGHHYLLHVPRPVEEWPDPIRWAFAHINPSIYVPMQGRSELGRSGSLEDWERPGDLVHIDVPTLVIGAEHDTMDLAHRRWTADQLPRGSHLHCPDGSHLCQFDDASHHSPGLLDFLGP